MPKFCAAHDVKANLLVKCEFFNPLASVKDRIGLNMILELEASGKLKPGGTLVEPTSGNTGIGLAFVAASRGYRLILTMPDSMSIERRRMLAYLGAELELTPKEKGMGGALAKAQEIMASIPGAVMPSQFDNPTNPAIHEKTTAEEIWTDTGGAVDGVFAGTAPAGTFTGTLVLEGPQAGRQDDCRRAGRQPGPSGEPGPHMIQGIGRLHSRKMQTRA
ncbi:MAG: pyridoxal-phosphate dependent enzyme [Hyphomonas sp.]